MKKVNTGMILQTVYCLFCLLIVIVMILYSMFYATPFGRFCLKSGEILTLLSTLFPFGWIGTVIDLRSNSNKTKRVRIRSILSAVLMVLCWGLAICFFVHFSGGV